QLAQHAVVVPQADAQRQRQRHADQHVLDAGLAQRAAPQAAARLHGASCRAVLLTVLSTTLDWPSGRRTMTALASWPGPLNSSTCSKAVPPSRSRVSPSCASTAARAWPLKPALRPFR